MLIVWGSAVVDAGTGDVSAALGTAGAFAIHGGLNKIAAGVGSVTIRNRHLAGKVHPKTGIPFDKDGFPDFSGVAKKTVSVPQTGDRAVDYAAANKAADLKETPIGFSWHHHQDGITMQLVPTTVHAKTGHTGGVGLHGNRK